MFNKLDISTMMVQIMNQILKKVLLVALLLAQSIPLAAQTTLGTITGRVLDSTGGAIATAAVTAESMGTHVVYRTRTNAAGNYVLAQLPVGDYELAIQAA